jgi:uncharacterized protein (DUF924 family)
MPEQVLAFWFKEIEPKRWWSVAAEFDTLLRERFHSLLQQAIRGELFQWRATPRGRLAEVIVLDQFSRNIFRNTPNAYSQDPLALALSQEAVASEAMSELEPIECAFLLMPYMHSESPLVHIEGERLYKQWAPEENYDFEVRHKAVIDRFGRYPHRNMILGRVSTPEEVEFLKHPGSSF